MEKETNMNILLSVNVDEEVIDRVRKGEVRYITINITESNYRNILEHVDGNLILDVDELPNTFHSCYYYNNGVFPYVISPDLVFLVLHEEHDECLTRIIGTRTVPTTRFRFQGPGKPSIEDPNGDSCIWNVEFDIVPMLKNPHHYLMRWNPQISSFTEKDYEECINHMENGVFRMNWSIYDWQEARCGDFFYMIRTGDDKSGLVFQGQFISDPYPGDDWAGSNRRRMYVDMVCMYPTQPGAKPKLSIEKLQETIPSIEWAKGHSGVLLPDDVAEKLVKLWHEG